MSDIDIWAKRVENMPLNNSIEDGESKESKFEDATTNKDISWAIRVPCWTCNVPLYIHYTLPVYWIVSSLFGLPNFSRFVFYLVANGPILMGTVFAHELGHAAAALISKGEVSHILLWPLGGLVYIAHQAGHCADIFISIAGPLTHVPMFLIWMLLNKSAEPKGIKWAFYVDDDDSYYRYFWGNLCSYQNNITTTHITHSLLDHSKQKQYFATRNIGTMAMTTNALLLVFNLFVPAYPLDGGRILANLVRFRTPVLSVF